MSDVFEGPGWWMASDGKWYPPARHPDETYRDRFTARPAAVTSQVDEFQAHTTPQTFRGNDETAATVSGSLDSAASGRGEAHVVEFAAATVVDEGPDSGAPVHEDPAFEQPVHEDPAFEQPVHEDPVFEQPVHETESVPARKGNDRVFVEGRAARTPAPDNPTETAAVRLSHAEIFGSEPLVETPPLDIPSRVPASVVTAMATHPDVQLELGNDRPTVEPTSRSGPTTSTDVVVVQPVNEPQGVPLGDRITATLIFLSGIAMIVGTFLTWVDSAPPASGWDRGDGIATIIAGIVGSAAAGPIFVGFRHAIPKAVTILAGLTGLVVGGLVTISTLDSSDATDVIDPMATIGIGLIVVGAASAAMLLAGMAQPSSDDNW